ncbi:MAG TPA: DUF4830 domain-containing protein [Candidatus Limnocylindria bacterium]|nr:DUF4830 domain-containing protein [Candidatus Limnocylindria bacterium]
MKLGRAAAMAFLVAAACSPSGAVFSGGACLTPAPPGSPGEPSIGALVDRADVIVLATVLRTEPTNNNGMDDQGARRLTLRTIQSAKAGAPAEFAVIDGPCPMLVATQGESLIAFLETDTGGAGLRPIGLPTSALRATASRTLQQLMAEIIATRPLDGDARGIFERNGWTVTAKHDISEFDIPGLSEFGLAGRQIRAASGAMPPMTEPFERYAVLSGDVGLDPRPYAGRRAELLTFWLERKPPEYAEGTPFGHVLIADRHVVGAWVTTFAEGGPFSVRDRAAALAAPTARRSFPPANRAPNGINIAQAYDLAASRTIYFKTGAGGNGEITDPARIRALVDALNTTLPTTQAIWDQNPRPTAYYLHFDSGTRFFSVVYDSQDGLLTVAADGFSVKPGAQFGTLVAEIR